MDKAPDFGMPFFYRVLLPGAVVTVLSSPLLSAVLSTVGVSGKDQTPYFLGIAIFLGFTLSLLDDPIYQVTEGRLGWPRWFARWRQGRWSRLVAAKYKRQKELPETSPEYAECWYLLRQFPVDDNGNPTTTRPSRIGNAIAAYEQYPYLRYGMDDTFYWPRLWLLLDKDARSEIDIPWAALDAILYTAVGVFVAAVAYLGLVLVSMLTALIGRSGPIVDPWAWLLTALWSSVLICFGLVCLRIALPSVVTNGERYKSVFDLYRKQLKSRFPQPLRRLVGINSRSPFSTETTQTINPYLMLQRSDRMNPSKHFGVETTSLRQAFEDPMTNVVGRPSFVLARRLSSRATRRQIIGTRAGLGWRAYR